MPFVFFFSKLFNYRNLLNPALQPRLADFANIWKIHAPCFYLLDIVQYMRTFHIPDMIKMCLVEVEPVIGLFPVLEVIVRQQVPQSVTRIAQLLNPPGGSLAVCFDDRFLGSSWNGIC